jgi:transposase
MVATRGHPQQTGTNPMIKATSAIKSHWYGLFAWHHKRISNAILESTKSMIQAGRAKARGYGTTPNLITMTHMIAVKLEFDLPT